MADIEKDLKIEYEVIRSNRKTFALQIKDGRLIARVPLRARRVDVERFIYSHREWIEEHLEIYRKRKALYADLKPLTENELGELGEKAREVIPSRVEHFSRLLGVDYGKISIRNQLTRWGSCSSSGNLSFNCLLMLAPPEVLDAIVAHELCHRKEMNHSKRFYAHLLSIYPEYHKWHAWLKAHGGELMQRNPKKV